MEQRDGWRVGRGDGGMRKLDGWRVGKGGLEGGKLVKDG